MSSKKIKVLTICDDPRLASGVGSQTMYVIRALLDSGKFQVVSLGGSLTNTDQRTVKFEEYGDDFLIYPVREYGNPEIWRSVMRTERPDVVYIMSDPRFFTAFFQMEDEIRPLAPIVWYSVWDNKPIPTFNKPWYSSTDKIVTISKLTDEVTRAVVPEHPDIEYLPHAVDDKIFRTYPADQVAKFRADSGIDKDKLVFFFNSRNARRKQTGSLLFWFKAFLDVVGHDKALLLMHTEPRDEYGVALEHIAHHLNLDGGQVMFSREKVPPNILAMMYNMADVTVNVSNAEGFGLSALESLSCGTPIIVNMTGGLQEQVTDGKEYFGYGIQPACQSVIGSQADALWIYEDHLKEEDVVKAFTDFYNLSPEARKELGEKGRAHVQKNYNYEKFGARWVSLMEETYEKHGSWETRKNYSPWEMKEVK